MFVVVVVDDVFVIIVVVVDVAAVLDVDATDGDDVVCVGVRVRFPCVTKICYLENVIRKEKHVVRKEKVVVGKY